MVMPHESADLTEIGDLLVFNRKKQSALAHDIQWGDSCERFVDKNLGPNPDITPFIKQSRSELDFLHPPDATG